MIPSRLHLPLTPSLALVLSVSASPRLRVSASPRPPTGFARFFKPRLNARLAPLLPLSPSPPLPLFRSLALIALTTLSLIGPAQAAALTRQQQVEVLNQAVRAFDRGTELRRTQPTEAAGAFQESAAQFQLLVDSGVRNGRLYYDLGNAWLQAGRLGKAIAGYRRAERLIPRDERLAANLGYARSLCRTQIAASGQHALVRTLFFWHFNTPLRTRFLIGLIAYLLFWALMIARNYAPQLRWAFALVPVLVVWLALAGSVGAEMLRPPPPAGVLIADEVTVRKGNGEGYEPQFAEKLHEGVEFTVREGRGDWLRIELADGKTGWIPARDAEEL